MFTHQPFETRHSPTLNIRGAALSFSLLNPGERTIYLILTVLLTISVAILIYRVIRLKKSNKLLRRIEQIRSDIFTKITDEFRTPLTIILGMSRQLREQKDIAPNNTLTYLNAIERQGKNLTELVGQLLDISNLQTLPKAAEWKTGNIVTFVEMIAETFRIYAGQKDISLLFFSEEKEIETDFIPDYLSKILHNLIDNAIKFSNDGSRIYLMVEKNRRDNNNITIKVIDNGRGIAEDELPHIFDLFYQGTSKGVQTGNGIGLTLTKQLIEILGGEITVESVIDRGTNFFIELPLQVSEKQLYPYWFPTKKGKAERANVPANIEREALFTTELNENDPRTKILLVEDNRDIALYVRSIFPPESYNIIYSSNGNKALQLALKHIPDIIIADNIIPSKNGIELCREIKSSPMLNHIPVIIISAKINDDDIIEGLKSGADSYLRKPFRPDELKLRVKNLIESHNLLKEKYRRTLPKEEKEAVRETGDENANAEFLRHATDIIYREMKNADFTPTKLARELAISVSQLNKKLNAIAGYPSSTYILQVKLSHAKKIITSQNRTIGEVAAECGIYDVNYFSRLFKKHIGLTPTQFRRLPKSHQSRLQ